MENDLVLRVKERVDIVNLISEYLPLKKSGHNFLALCPFHKEKTPSFMVNPSKQVFHCFGCGEGGDLFTFVMKIDGLPFKEALASLAARAGLRIEKEHNAEPDAGKSQIYAMLDKISLFYSSILKDGKSGRPGMEYLVNRRISPEIIDEYRLGYIPNAWNLVSGRFGRTQKDIGMLEAAGLIIKKKEGIGYFDRFRDRIIFPIHDPKGRVIAFGGRAVGSETQPKYLNSPETVFFEKGKQLYGLDKALPYIKKSGYAIIVEGYIDLLRLVQTGKRETVATLGTACTEEHLRLLKRACNKIYLIFDGDAAGEKATERVFNACAASKMDAQVVRLPVEEDPDSFILKFGREEFDKLFEKSETLIVYILRQKSRYINSLKLEEKGRAVEAVMEMVVKIDDPFIREDALKKLSEGIEVKIEFLAEMLGKKVASLRSREYLKDRAGAGEKKKAVAGVIPKEEELLLHIILNNKINGSIILENIRPELFTVEIFKILTQLIVNEVKNGAVLSADRLHAAARNLKQGAETEEELRKMMARLLVVETGYDDVSKTFNDCILTLVKRHVDKFLKQLEKKKKKADELGNYDTFYFNIGKIEKKIRELLSGGLAEGCLKIDEIIALIQEEQKKL